MENNTPEELIDLVPVTYFVRRGGLCYIESSGEAKIGGVHIATVANEKWANTIMDAINKLYLPPPSPTT